MHVGCGSARCGHDDSAATEAPSLRAPLYIGKVFFTTTLPPLHPRHARATSTSSPPSSTTAPPTVSEECAPVFECRTPSQEESAERHRGRARSYRPRRLPPTAGRTLVSSLPTTCPSLRHPSDVLAVLFGGRETTAAGPREGGLVVGIGRRESSASRVHNHRQRRSWYPLSFSCVRLRVMVETAY